MASVFREMGEKLMVKVLWRVTMSQDRLIAGPNYSMDWDFSSVRRRTLRIHPFQQKRDADADEKDWPDPTRVDVDHAKA